MLWIPAKPSLCGDVQQAYHMRHVLLLFDFDLIGVSNSPAWNITIYWGLYDLIQTTGNMTRPVLDYFTLILARHLADVSCFIGPSMPSEICMEIHTKIVQKIIVCYGYIKAHLPCSLGSVGHVARASSNEALSSDVIKKLTSANLIHNCR